MNNHLLETLNYVQTNSPFYQNHFKRFQFNANFNQATFQNLPFTTKDHLASNNLDFCCVSKSKVAEYVTTSGTQGDPVTIYMTNNDLDRLAENERFSLARMGGSDKDLYQLLTTLDKQFMAGLAYYLGALKLNAGIIRMGPGSVAEQWRSILNNKPTQLIAVPSFIPNLLDYAKKNNIDYNQTSIKSIICVGEPIRKNDFSLNSIGKSITDKWNVKLYSTYASTEMGCAFSECEHGQGGHINNDLIYLEVLDENDQQVANGEVGEIVITTLKMEGTPFVRYKTGDIATFWNEKCKCGDKSVRLGPILGRKNQLIKYKGTSIYPQTIINTLKSIEGITTYHIEVLQKESTTVQLIIHLAKEQIAPINFKDLKYKLQAELRVLPEINLMDQKTLENITFMPDKRKPNTISFKTLL